MSSGQNASGVAASGPVEVVFFDVGGTILRANPSVGEIYARRALEHGFEADAVALNARFRVAWRDSLTRSRARAFTCDDATLYDEWFQIVAQTFEGDVPQGSIRGLFEDLYELFVSPGAWTLAPGARATFEMLRQRGVRLGVLSNWDRRLRETLEGLQLLPLFDPALIKISHEVGFEKPHEAMFGSACESAAIEPGRILHIGDSLEADIAPANARGMRTFWISDRDPPAGAPQPSGRGASFGELTASDWDELLG